MTNTELIQELIEGQSDLQMEFYRRFHLAAYRSALRLVVDPATAEDICHDTILHALNHLHQLKNQDAPEGWIKTIARNRALTFLKQSRRLELSESPADEEFTTLHDTTDHDNYAYTTEDILQEIETLPDGYRVVITLHLLDELSHEAIADELGISAATSRSQYLRGKHHLRKRLIERHAQHI